MNYSWVDIIYFQPHFLYRWHRFFLDLGFIQISENVPKSCKACGNLLVKVCMNIIRHVYEILTNLCNYLGCSQDTSTKYCYESVVECAYFDAHSS